MSENEQLQSPDFMPTLRLSDVRTPDGGLPGDEDTGRAEARLGQDVYDLKEENRLLRRKLHLLQKNSNLKQVALIGTVISWFGDKGLLEDSTERLAAMMMSARATEQSVPPTAESGRVLLDDIPWEERGDGGLLPKSVLKSHAQNEDEISTSASLHPNEKDIENYETYQWLSKSLESSFNPPFSSSRKGMKNSINIQENGASLTDPIGNGNQQFKDYKTVPAFQVDGIATKTVSFDEGVHRLDTRLRRIEKAVNNFSKRHDETRTYLARLRQNAVKRFRVWKAITASHESAASKASRDEGENEDLTEQHRIIPTPLTQISMKCAAEKADSFTGSGFNPNRTILGEIAFQVERRILAFVFQREKLLYGYNLGNLDLVIRTHFDQGSRSVLQHRYDYLMDVLRGYGWVTGRHPQFVAEMIKGHGVFQDVETSRVEAMKRGWNNPSALKRGLLCLCPVREVLDMLVILDCLLHMVRNDGLPVFLW